MKLLQGWLNNFVDCMDLSADELEDILTTKIAEVDDVFPSGPDLAKALVVKVITAEPHPERPKLRVATVDTGKAQVTVICGAPNCRPGLVTIYVPPGGSVIDAKNGGMFEVGSRAFGSVTSNGVLTSEKELGISAEHEGIIELSEDLKPGTPAASVLPQLGAIFEIDNKSLTHRPDLWCHLGFAKELSAVLARPLKFDPTNYAFEVPKSLAAAQTIRSNYTIAVDPETKCKRFTCVEVEGLRVQQSPLWMRAALYAVGAGVRNLLVDLSNYVMLDVGQPNHVFDRERFKGRNIRVRMATKGEELLGLNGFEYKLTAEDVVVADSEAALSLAGILGGEPSAVNDGTTAVLLESATWEPVSLRLQTKRHGVRTDASNRFEKSRSPIAAPLAIYRYMELLLKEIPEVRFSQLVDCYPEKQAPQQIEFSCNYIRERLGLEVPDDRIKAILTSLGFRLSGKDDCTNDGGRLIAEVPFERATRDISIPDDLVEEVGRIIGYAEVPECAPLISCDTQKRIPILDFEHEFRDFLRAEGFNEVYLYSFFNEAAAKDLGIDVSKAVKLENPIDSQLDVMRTSLVPGLIECVRKNQRFNESVAVFEVGRTAFERLKKKGEVRDTGADEGRRLGLAYVVDAAVKKTATLHQQLKAESFYAVAQVVQRMLWGIARVCAELVPADEKSGLTSWMHPYRAANVVVDGAVVGVIAESNPAVVSDISGRLILVELDVDKLLKLRRAVEEFRPLRRFPDSFFEISAVSDEAVPYAELERFIRTSKTAGQLQRIELLDIYKGEPLKAGEKSTSVRLSFGNPDSTLSAEEVKSLQDTIVSEFKGSPFSLRSS